MQQLLLFPEKTKSDIERALLDTLQITAGIKSLK
jgi:hypothetical protein